VLAWEKLVGKGYAGKTGFSSRGGEGRMTLGNLERRAKKTLPIARGGRKKGKACPHLKSRRAGVSIPRRGNTANAGKGRGLSGARDP